MCANAKSPSQTVTETRSVVPPVQEVAGVAGGYVWSHRDPGPWDEGRVLCLGCVNVSVLGGTRNHTWKKCYCEGRLSTGHTEFSVLFPMTARKYTRLSKPKV